jgi:hypothetical protein
MTMVWRALLVHPKTAVLFLRGVPAHEALFQAFAWYQWLPIGSQEHLAPLLKFMLGATTEDAANPAVSVIQTTWCRKDPGESDTFKTWYYELLAQHVPVRASSPETAGGVLPVAPAAPPHSLGGWTEGLLDQDQRNVRAKLSSASLRGRVHG